MRCAIFVRKIARSSVARLKLIAHRSVSHADELSIQKLQSESLSSLGVSDQRSDMLSLLGLSTLSSVYLSQCVDQNMTHLVIPQY